MSQLSADVVNVNEVVENLTKQILESVDQNKVIPPKVAANILRTVSTLPVYQRKEVVASLKSEMDSRGLLNV